MVVKGGRDPALEVAVHDGLVLGLVRRAPVGVAHDGARRVLGGDGGDVNVGAQRVGLGDKVLGAHALRQVQLARLVDARQVGGVDARRRRRRRRRRAPGRDGPDEAAAAGLDAAVAHAGLHPAPVQAHRHVQRLVYGVGPGAEALHDHQRDEVAATKGLQHGRSRARGRVYVLARPRCPRAPASSVRRQRLGEHRRYVGRRSGGDGGGGARGRRRRRRRRGWRLSGGQRRRRARRERRILGRRWWGERCA